MHWYFLISSYYLTVLNGHSLTALKSVEVTQCSGSFKQGGSICLWYLHLFSMHWYFLISSYYLTVSNGHSLTALKSVEVTQCSGSFEWGGLADLPQICQICAHLPFDALLHRRSFRITYERPNNHQSQQLVTGTLGQAPISNSQSQARKVRQGIPACKCKTRKLPQHAKCREAIPVCIAKTL